LFNSVLDEIVPEYEGKINMYKVDIEESPEIATMFGARGIPYMVFISESGEASPNVGALTTDQLKYYFDGLISKK